MGHKRRRDQQLQADKGREQEREWRGVAPIVHADRERGWDKGQLRAPPSTRSRDRGWDRSPLADFQQERERAVGRGTWHLAWGWVVR